MKNFVKKIFCLKNKELESLKLRINALEEENSNIKALMNTVIDIRNIPKAKGALRKVQEADAILLNIFDKICLKYNIEFWLDYGTLLGAVRHNGFIPWDDDIDVAMPRSDYDKISEILNYELGEFGFLVNEGAGFGFQIKRLLYKNSPVQIDIFPYDVSDEIVDTDEKRKLLSEKIIKCNKMLFQKYNHHDLFTGKIEFPRQGLSLLQNEIISENYPCKTCETFYTGPEALPYSKPNIFSKNNIFPLAKHQFEGYLFSVPGDFDTYLKLIYNDYMSFPNFKVLGHNNIDKINESQTEKAKDELKLLEKRFMN